MGDAADDMYEMEMDWVDNKAWCDKHKIWHLGREWGCPKCEDGVPVFKPRHSYILSTSLDEEEDLHFDLLNDEEFHY